MLNDNKPNASYLKTSIHQAPKERDPLELYSISLMTAELIQHMTYTKSEIMILLYSIYSLRPSVPIVDHKEVLYIHHPLEASTIYYDISEAICERNETTAVFKIRVF